MATANARFVAPATLAAVHCETRIQATIQAHRWDLIRMPKPTNKVKKMLTTPDGMFMRAAFLGVYPRFRISVAE
ncbi:hypothetical protein BN1723_002936 [Verticillium longisporum]|uniref:Uncharacterized protein n=1 Tax=Verticillium longisporum TaxID=100787 RepID=A0A0G4LKJ1_VERLO|nr:hypothetical protein BN1723_002936 [Verticillium longisporum]